MRLRLATVGNGQMLEHVFGPEGGVFGRSVRCDWVLPDPQRILSSIHGRIFVQNGVFLLADESTNGIFLPGASDPIGRGNAVPVTNGMRFHAGPLVLEAELLASAAVATDPSRQQTWQAPNQPLAAPGGQAQNALRERDQLGDLWGRHSQDPLEYLGTAAAGRPDTQAPDLLTGMGLPPVMPAPPIPGSRSPAAGLPAQPNMQPSAGSAHDGFASAGPVSAPPPGMQGSGAHGGPAAARPPMPPQGQPPMAIPVPPGPTVAGAGVAGPQAPAPARKLIPDDFDPLSMLGIVPAKPPAQQVPNSVSAPLPEPARRPLSADLMADLMPIEPGRGPMPPMPDLPPRDLPARDPAEFDAAKAMRLRSDERRARLQDKLDMGAGSAVPAFAAAQPRYAAAGDPTKAGPPPFPAAPPGPQAVPVAASSKPRMSGPGRALFRGMGFPDVDIAPAMEEQILQDVGEMVRALTDGLVTLLAARRMVKSEFRMDETQIQPEENNPFKHFRMAELALDELFITRSGGFLPPGEAAATALDDVKAHVMVTMAAMQRAIRLFAERLDPKQIAQDDGEGADRIRGFGVRKGKWESYVEVHRRLSANLDGVARQIIAEAFAQVQEEHARQAVSQHREGKK